jgi:predicted DNA binding CopG/RHH family protein
MNDEIEKKEEVVEERKPKHPGGRPVKNENSKKKSCNIYLTKPEITMLELMAAAYGLNKSSFIALIIHKLHPFLQKLIYNPELLTKDQRQFLRLLNDRFDITPCRENVSSSYQAPNHRSTYKANYSRRRLKDDLEDLEYEKERLEFANKMLESDIQDMQSNMSHNNDLHRQVSESSDRYIKILEDKVNKLEEQLRNKKS